MSAKHSTSSAKGHPIQQGLVFLAILLVIEVIVFNLSSSVLEFAKGYLSLTFTDLVFIPIGSFMFFVFWKVMEHGVFDPYLELHEARETATHGSQEVADQKLAEATRLENETADLIHLSRRDAVQEKLAKLAEAKKIAAELISETENQALLESEKTLKEASERIAHLRAELENQAQDLVGEVVDKLKSAPQIATSNSFATK